MGSKPAGVVELRCPCCSRFVGETDGYLRVICAGCGWEITARSPQVRRTASRDTYPLGGIG